MSDRDIGRKEFERESLDYFLDAYGYANDIRLKYGPLASDFVCRTPTGEFVGIDIIKEAKPALPPDAQRLHFLSATPFRYASRPPAGSRFRQREDSGVLYGAEDVPTACAEAGYWRLRFWLDSEGLRARPTSLPMTLFEFHGGATQAALDLTKPPLVARREDWIQPDDYRASQALAAEAREIPAELIRYESVRDGPDGRCLAILAPWVFRAVREAYQHNQQCWSLFLQPPGLTVWQRELDGTNFEFRFGT
ncbi:MAG: RES family NAD+ phosphorylase [Pseudomonadota bacterium]